MKKTKRAALPMNRWWLSPVMVYAALAALQLALQWAARQPIQMPPFPFS